MQGTQRLCVGQHLDVLDTVSRWCNAEVLKVAGPQFYICYTGWSSKYNQWLPMDSNRYLTQWQPGKQIQVNNRIDVKHPIPNKWLEARVIEINGCQIKFDKWVDIDNKDEVATIGTYSNGYGVGKRRNKQLVKVSEQVLNKIKNFHIQFKQSLKARQLVIKTIGADGNCLFRTISDQLYGTQQHHFQIRQIVMDYIYQEKSFYQDYVLENIDNYIQRKRNSGVWGDDVQLQAISEIYNRPIQVYVNDQKPIRTFHQDNDENIFPIRIAYQGSCHYNSIKQQGYEEKGIMQDKFMIWQSFFMQNIKNSTSKQDIYRNQFATKQTVDQALNNAFQSKQNVIQVQDQMLKITETNSLLDQIQTAQIRQAQLIQQKHKIDEQLRRIQQMQMQQIKKQSLRDQQKSRYSFQQQLWVQSIRQQGFSDDEILMGIQAKGNNPDEVLNYLYDNF